MKSCNQEQLKVHKCQWGTMTVCFFFQAFLATMRNRVHNVWKWKDRWPFGQTWDKLLLLFFSTSTFSRYRFSNFRNNPNLNMHRLSSSIWSSLESSFLEKMGGACYSRSSNPKKSVDLSRPRKWWGSPISSIVTTESIFTANCVFWHQKAEVVSIWRKWGHVRASKSQALIGCLPLDIWTQSKPISPVSSGLHTSDTL